MRFLISLILGSCALQTVFLCAPRVQAGESTVQVQLQSLAGTRLSAVQTKAVRHATDGQVTFKYEFQSSFEVEVEKPSGSGPVLEIKRSGFSWDIAKYRGPLLALISVTGSAARAEAELGLKRTVELEPNGAVHWLPDGLDFERKVLAAFKPVLERYFSNPLLTNSLQPIASVRRLVDDRFNRAKMDLAGSEPDLVGTWIFNPFIFPYGDKISLNRYIKPRRVPEPIRWSGRTMSETTLVVTRDTENPSVLIATFVTLYDEPQLSRRLRFVGERRIEQTYERSRRLRPDREAELRQWADEQKKKVNDKVRGTRVDRTTLKLDAVTGWPILFEASSLSKEHNLNRSFALEETLEDTKVTVQYMKR